MSPSRTTELASIISAKTSLVDDYLTTHNLPPLSFEPNEDSQEHALPDSVKEAQNEILEATDELHALMLGPKGILNQHLRSCTQLVGLHAINHYKIAEKFPKDRDEISYAELSHDTGLEEFQLRRLLRQAMTYHFFTEPTKDTISHTAASKMLLAPHAYERIGTTCDEIWPAATKAVHALAKWPGSQHPHQTGFTLENNTDKSMFEYMAQIPWRADRFAGAMSFRAQNPGDHVSHLLDGYPWADQGTSCTVIDVGGSKGPTSIALATQFPNLTCIVQDLPGTVKGCVPPAELDGRVRFMAHDFFTEQPVQGAEIYFFRRVFHDWSDEYAAKMLRCLIGALKPGGKVLIQDAVVPEFGSTSLFEQRRHRYSDLNMLAMLNARERSAEEWGDLVRLADERFELSRIIQPPGANQAIIEIVWGEK